MQRWGLTVFGLVLLARAVCPAQAASCVHGSGVPFLLDAYLAALGACNCEKAPVFLSTMPACSTNEYVLEFDENFDGTTLDTAVWQIQPWGQGPLENAPTMEYNSLDNVTVKDGICLITARRETVERRAVNWKNDADILDDGKPNLRTFEYTSANLWTKQKFFRGKYEIRCKLPRGNGFWPAFWMFGGKRWNEIDVFDAYSGTDVLVTSIGHDYEGNAKSNGCSRSYKGFDMGEWHTYTCLFGEEKISFLVDGETVRIIPRFVSLSGAILSCNDDLEPGSYYQLKSYPIEPMSIIVNLALTRPVSKGHFVPVDASTPFPSALEIDYIKMWKQDAEPASLLASPNPAIHELHLSSNARMLSLKICNTWGEPVYQASVLSDTVSVDLSALPGGLYVVIAEFESSIRTRKIIKL